MSSTHGLDKRSSEVSLVLLCRVCVPGVSSCAQSSMSNDYNVNGVSEIKTCKCESCLSLTLGETAVPNLYQRNFGEHRLS